MKFKEDTFSFHIKYPTKNPRILVNAAAVNHIVMNLGAVE